jgi:hypothetical protein
MKNKKRIPTAEEMYQKWFKEAMENLEKPPDNDGPSLMIKYFKEFAKLHVKAALQAASTKATLKIENFFWGRDTPYDTSFEEEYRGHEGVDEDPVHVSVNKDSILNAYPETNII